MNLDIEKIKAALSYHAYVPPTASSRPQKYHERLAVEALAALDAYDPDAKTIAPSFDHYWQIVLHWAQDMDILKKMSIHEMRTLSERLQSITANTLGTIDPDTIRRENIRLAEKLRQYLPHCGKQDMTNGDRELVEWVEAILNAGKEYYY